jgi:ABC-2 type transport system permease protein
LIPHDDHASSPARAEQHGGAAVEALPMVRVNPPQPFFRGFLAAVVEIWRYRELLVNLTRKELKVKYKESVLGFVWSMARPAFHLAIYYVAIGKFLGASIPDFPIYLFSGLIAWNMFTDILNNAVGSIVGNGGLIKKVYFPREILPLSVVGGAIVHFFIQLGVLVAAMVVFRHGFVGMNLLYLPPALITLIVLAAALGLALSAANVYLRDTQHLLEVVLLFLFWMSPIVYPITFVLGRLHGALLTLYLANPLTILIMTIQRALYASVYVNGEKVLFSGDLLGRLLIVMAMSFGFLWLSQRIFARAQGNFAQEL